MEQNRTKTNKNYYLETEIHPGSAAWKATLKGFPKLKEQFLRENLSFSMRLNLQEHSVLTTHCFILASHEHKWPNILHAVLETQASLYRVKKRTTVALATRTDYRPEL